MSKKKMCMALLFTAACITGLSGIKETVYAAEAEQIEEDTKGASEYYTYNTPSGEWEYSIKKDGTIYLETYYGKNSDVVEIPSEIDGRVVTGFSRVWYPEDLEIKTIIIPETIVDIERYVVSSTASYTLEEIIVKEGNQTYMSMDGVLYDKQGETLIWCPPNKKKLTVPEGVKTIGKWSCSYDDFTELELPDSLKTIEFYAFCGCYYLTDLTIPGSVETIDSSAFHLCTGLKSVSIQEGVKTIGKRMFCDCEKLSSVQLPESLTTIEDYVFSGCTKLKNINLPDGLTSIGKSAFSSCDSLVNVIIPNQVTIIKNTAFAYCDSLESIRIPDSVKQIATKTFSESNKVVIECSDNSYAKKYAQKKGIPYQIITNTSENKLGIQVNGQSVKNFQTLKVKVKKSYTLQAVQGTEKASVKWKSSNTKVAIVKNGKVTMKKAGKATITATALNGKKVSITLSAAKAAVKVTKVQATGSRTMKKGSTQILNLTVTPASADNTKVSWKSSNKKIVTVDNNGKVTAKKKGTVVITATAKDGSKKKGSIKITVK